MDFELLLLTEDDSEVPTGPIWMIVFLLQTKVILLRSGLSCGPLQSPCWYPGPPGPPVNWSQSTVHPTVCGWSGLIIIIVPFYSGYIYAGDSCHPHWSILKSPDLLVTDRSSPRGPDSPHHHRCQWGNPGVCLCHAHHQSTAAGVQSSPLVNSSTHH